jgi:ethanolamine transporter EutH
LEKHTGLNGASTTGLLLGLFTATPALAMIPQMDKRGKVVVSACLVSCVCVLGAHFAFTAGVHPDLVPALLTAKFLGGMVGGSIAMISTRNKNT